MTTVYGVQCPRCHEEIWSRHRHDCRSCSCGYCYIDGGRDYIRIGWGDPEGPTGLYGPPVGVEIELEMEGEDT